MPPGLLARRHFYSARARLSRGGLSLSLGRMNHFLACMLLLFALSGQAQTLPPLQVEVKRVVQEDMTVYDITASGAVKASPGAVWKILTNYDKMPEFVPDLATSRVLSRSGDDAIIEQFGEARFLFVRRDIHLIVLAKEQPMNRIVISLVSGDMKVYQCQWELVALAETGGTRINYTGKMAPKFYVPGMLGANIIKGDIARMMAAVLARLDRTD